MGKLKISNAYILAGIAIFFWATASTAFKLGLRHLDPENLLLYASITSLMFFSVIYWYEKKPVTKKQLFASAKLGFLNPFAYYLVLFHAYDLLRAQEAQVLNYTWAIMMLLLSVPVLKVKLKIIDILTILLSFSGVIVIASKGKIFSLNFSNSFGVFLAVSSAVIWALFWLYNVKDKRSEENKLFYSFLFGTIYLIIYLAITNKIQIPNFKGIVASIYIGLFEMGITFLVWMKALKKSESPSKIANLIYVTPFLSLLLINFVLKERIYFSTLIGLILILSGNVSQKYFEKRDLKRKVK